jgi:hypothetical protein
MTNTTQLRNLIASLVDDDPCSFDHDGGCQAHGYISLASNEECPMAEAKRLLAEPEPDPVAELQPLWNQLHEGSLGMGPHALALANKARGIVLAMSHLTQQAPDVIEDQLTAEYNS